MLVEYCIFTNFYTNLGYRHQTRKTTLRTSTATHQLQFLCSDHFTMLAKVYAFSMGYACSGSSIKELCKNDFQPTSSFIVRAVITMCMLCQVRVKLLLKFYTTQTWCSIIRVVWFSYTPGWNDAKMQGTVLWNSCTQFRGSQRGSVRSTLLNKLFFRFTDLVSTQGGSQSRTHRV